MPVASANANDPTNLLKCQLPARSDNAGSGGGNLSLRRGADDNLAHVNIGRLFDCKRNHPGNGTRWHGKFIDRGEICALASGLVTDSAKFVRVKAGDMTVTRSLSPCIDRLNPQSVSACRGPLAPISIRCSFAVRSTLGLTSYGYRPAPTTSMRPGPRRPG